MGEIGFVFLLIVVVGVPLTLSRKPVKRAPIAKKTGISHDEYPAAIGKQFAAEQLSGVLVRVRGGISGETQCWSNREVPVQGHGSGHGGGHH